MKIILGFGIGLIGISLIALIVSSVTAGMVNYAQEDIRSLATQGALKYPYLCEAEVHEAGYARITLGILGLFTLFIPYRRRELWAWISLAILFLWYLRIFVYPPGASLPGWAALNELVSRPELPRFMVLNWVFPALMLLGLGLSLPAFLHSKRAPAT